MVRLELTADQAGALGDILEQCLSELRMEIAGTEEMTFREGLESTEIFLKDLIPRLRKAA